MPDSNNTWAGMIALNMTVTVYCSPCNRSAKINMTKLPPDGTAIGVRFRCSICGKRGHSIISPPTSELSLPADFYGTPPTGPRPAPLVKRRRRKQ